MKILLGLAEYPPHNIGGGGIVFQNLVREYRQAGHEVVVVYGYYLAQSWREKVERWVDEQGAVIYKLPELPYPKNKAFLKTVMPPNGKSWLAIRRIVAAEKPDVAHLHGYGHLIIDLLARACRKRHIPYVFTNHGFPKIPFQRGGVIKATWTAYSRLIGQYLPRHAAFITCVSLYTASEYQHAKEKISVIPNGVDITFRPVSDKQLAVLRAKLPAQGKRVILSVGRVMPYKGFQDVIAALPSLPQLLYVIVGPDQNYQAHLEQKAKDLKVEDRVVFVGPVKSEELDAYYQLADVVVIPSHVESFGLIGLEALKNQRPVISSGAQGLKYLAGSRNVYEYSSPEELVERLRQQPHYHSEEFIGKFAWPTVARQYLTLLKKAVES